MALVPNLLRDSGRSRDTSRLDQAEGWGSASALLSLQRGDAVPILEAIFKAPSEDAEPPDPDVPASLPETP